ncbi:MAG: WD40/YVTN/BNR-like repeat-containing protein, partial [Actinomycetota bacterium]
MAETEVLVGTRKGLFVLRGDRRGPLEVAARCFEERVVEYACFDARSGTYLASVTHWPEEVAKFFPGSKFGPHVYFTSNVIGEWREADGPTFPEYTGAVVVRTWVIQPGEEDGVLWAGVAPAALFRSDDDGRSWTLNRALWDHPSRPQWQAGGGGLCLHSICPYPGDPARLSVGISAAGVWHTDNRGASWRRGVKGLVNRYLPEEEQEDALILCVHNLHRALVEPDTMYQQFHGGVYRSDDGGETWQSIAEGLPSDFGLPMVVDPGDPDRAFVIPLVSDLDRVTPEGKVRVYETLDRGASWRALTKGLPQRDAYLTILRQAFCGNGNHPLGRFFGATSGDVFG